MTKTRKTLFYITLLMLCMAAGGYIYVHSIAQGKLAKWDPENYRTVNANGLNFAVNVRGNPAHTPVILLHGFPEAAVMWDPFMDMLADNDYYAIAPNQRGYSSGARPTDVQSYALEHLVADIHEIADQLGLEQFHLIGHDWGAAVGWQLAAEHPQRVLSYAALSVPHIDAFAQAYREDTEQFEASEYMRFFQKTLIPEFVLANNDYTQLRTVWDQHEQTEIDHYLRIFGQKNALTAALNWYRANFVMFDADQSIGPVSVPTTLIWGNQDTALKRAGVADTRNRVSAEYTFIEMDAGHWIIQQRYQALAEHLMTHLSKYR